MTGLVDLPGYPYGTRLIVRRECPQPGAQLSLSDQDEGMRHQVFLTDTPYSGGGSIQHLAVRHRGHAIVPERLLQLGRAAPWARRPRWPAQPHPAAENTLPSLEEAAYRAVRPLVCCVRPSAYRLTDRIPASSYRSPAASGSSASMRARSSLVRWMSTAAAFCSR